MTKPKHKFPIITLGFILLFFCGAFINSSFFNLKEIRFEGLNPCLEKEIKSFSEGLKGKNLIFLNLEDLNLENYPFLEVEIFQKILPDKLLIKFKIKEELGTFITEYGSFDLYKKGFLFPRCSDEKEKFIIEGNTSKEKLEYLSENLEKNDFIYENFIGVKYEKEGCLKFLSKRGYFIEISEKESLNNLNKVLGFLAECPNFFEKQKISMINSKLFIAENKGEK